MLKHNLTPKPSISNADIVQRDNKTQFYKLMSPELKEMYEAKLLDAPAYILLIVKTQRASGWKWTFKVKDFCKEWGISKTSFYRAVSKLKDMGRLHWESGDTITVWHGTDIPRENSPDTGNNDFSCPENSPTIGTAFPIVGNKVPQSGLKKAETLTSSNVQSAPDIIQINSDQTNNIVVDLKAFEKKEEEATIADLPVEVLDRSAPLVISKVESSPVDLTMEREVLNEIRRLGIERNESVLGLLKKHAANVPDALAYLKQCQGKGEIFANITGAFVDALKKGKKPVDTEPSFGLHYEVNPPREQQLQALEDARNKRLILDYFFSSIDNTHKVILNDGLTQVLWWEYLASLQETCP